MFSCDYNGWADVSEEEREAIDAFEASRSAAGLQVGLVRAVRVLRSPSYRRHRASSRR